MDRVERSMVVACFTVVGALLLYFVGVPLLGYFVGDWGRFLLAVCISLAVFSACVGGGIAWAARGADADR
ncbi:hypothetical protein HMF7854_04210 [Sphingomonas ginkgonis]|uniref:Uncharacterized protein n=1 Tax=Sphingomonas ginkgonis TaxID=2315330 RepID=A0A3R9Z5B5_9SPHN|nr:hypothetical protein [Sphingomonas ginkgonis]RST30114.1 hypothetical protein HMF7854_04210 [Sphingomonas ginkgonis]